MYVFGGVDQAKIKINIPSNADINTWRTAFDAAGYTTIIIEKQAPPLISITTPQSDFISGVAGESYSLQLQGSESKVTYTIESGNLPDGLTLSKSGLISGIPTKVGTFTFTIMVGNGTISSSADYTIKVTQADVDEVAAGAGVVSEESLV